MKRRQGCQFRCGEIVQNPDEANLEVTVDLVLDSNIARQGIA